MYNQIKRIGDVKLGIHTICVVGSKFKGNNERYPNEKQSNGQYLANIALKLNLSLGGINQTLEDKNMGIIKHDNTMVVGLDVTHPSPGSLLSAPSFAAMVASVDRFLGQWPADLRVQESCEEMVTELESMLDTRLELWITQPNHKKYPENLLIFRDGLSEGQYQQVLDKELPLFRKACRRRYPATDTALGPPRITIVIVGKRHHPGFYPTIKTDADWHDNPENGIVVDRGVTEGRNWDYFLPAHTALKGTARPAYYYVVLDEIFTRQNIKGSTGANNSVADELQSLTHNMCYLFGRATKAVSVCPPAYWVFNPSTPPETPAPSKSGYAAPQTERSPAQNREHVMAQLDIGTARSRKDKGKVEEASARDWAKMRENVLIRPRLRDTMFYI